MKKFFSFTIAIFMLISMVSLVGCNGLWDFDDDDDAVLQPIAFNVKGAVNLAPNPNIRAAVDLTNKKAQAWRVKNDGTEEQIGSEEFDVDPADGSYEVTFSSYAGYFFIRIIDPNNSNFEMMTLLGNLGAADANKDGIEVNSKTTAKALVRRTSGKIVDPDDILDADVATIQTQIETAIANNGDTSNVVVTVAATAVAITNADPLGMIMGGEAVELKATPDPVYTTDTLVWTIDSGAAFITLSGSTVTPVAEGTAVVKVTAGSVSDTITINVTAADVAVTTITVADASVAVGSTVTLTPTVLPANASDKTVTWTSATPAVASVNSTTGVVTGVSAGTAVITATANDGSGVKGTCTVTVTAVVTEVATVTFDKAVPSLSVGDIQIHISGVPSTFTTETTVTKKDDSSTTYTLKKSDIFSTNNSNVTLKSWDFTIWDAEGFQSLTFNPAIPVGATVEIKNPSGTVLATGNNL